MALGIGLAAWCAAVLVEARYTSQLPLETASAIMHVLPGDSGAGSTTSHGARRRSPTPRTGSVLARLELPRLQLSTPVLEGSDDATLSRGAGHIEDTPLPGEPGNVGIAGHRDTVFRALRNAKVGDLIDLRTADRVLHYRIAKTLIVKPEDVYVLDSTDEPTLTLVTCYPFEYIGHAPKRFILQAKQAR